ncbi:hypothetical protein E2562_022142 [Oryza meyeriana var. granulata]|uniref:Uncharacterized protein n=1 Tax=Oryza meyeriana var. granulata TaxID=110450 RepID=A0A6G1BMD6_9ORYZ|nr:hypothetical protein E2562_022142 [Oryza meyeriana var. granulata]
MDPKKDKLHLKEGIATWQGKKNKASELILGCTVVLLICYLDSFLPEQDLETPRIKFYNTEKIQQLLEEAWKEDNVNAKVSKYRVKVIQVSKGKDKNKCDKPKPKVSKGRKPTSKIHPETGQDIVIHFPSATDLVKECAETLKPDGQMSNFIVDALGYIWNKGWKDKIMLSHLAVELLLVDVNKHGPYIVDKAIDQLKLQYTGEQFLKTRHHYDADSRKVMCELEQELLLVDVNKHGPYIVDKAIDQLKLQYTGEQFLKTRHHYDADSRKVMCELEQTTTGIHVQLQ